MSHTLDYWKQYLSVEDYIYLINFVENIKHDIPNDQMIILFGASLTGKTTLIRDIEDYVGTYRCSPIYNMWSTVYDSPDVVLFNIDGFNVKEDYDDELENIIHSGKSVISTTTKDPHLHVISDPALIEHVRIIQMSTIFP
jgi:tRNA A37 threonylcarbamoyladenosine biosynthesis protein TsaE